MMTLKEVLETKVTSLIVAGKRPDGETVYDLVTDDHLAYPPVGEKAIRQVRPDLLDDEKVSLHSGYGAVDI